MVTRMETAVWPKHEVGCEVDKITSWTSTTWKSVANISRNTTARNGWRPTRIIPIQFIFRYGGNSEHTFILNIYVDDLTSAGGNKNVQMQFWKGLKFRAKTDPEQYIEENGVKVLGRVHSIQRNPKQVVMTNDRRSYSKGITSFYCEIAGMRQEKLRKVSAPCLLENQMTDEELAHEGEMHAFAARILMRCLWLSRFARPDNNWLVETHVGINGRIGKICDW